MCGGAQFSPNTSHVIQKRTVNAALPMVIRPTRRTATNFIFDGKFAVHNILQYFWGLGKTTYSQDRFLAMQVCYNKLRVTAIYFYLIPGLPCSVFTVRAT